MATAQQIREAVFGAVELGVTFDAANMGFRTHMFVAKLCALLDMQGEDDLVAALDRLLNISETKPSAAMFCDVPIAINVEGEVR